MPFTVLDGILVAIMLVSAALAMIRGFTREVFSIASWVAAAAATYFLWEDLLPYVQQYIDDKNLALGVTVVAIFFVTLLVVSLITMRISDFILDSKAGPLDRTLGFIFGAGRGLVLVVIAVLFLNFFIAPDKQPPWISDARTKPWLDSIGNDLLAALPEDPEAEIMERLRGEEPTEVPRTAEEPGAEPGIAEDDQNALDRQLRSGQGQ
ncbi:CvpA family protein [Faunimonas sp. B44]|uniref:CvpA family protein n=1 Tax=Faunimonas sp. B44 TaxID=3461493 RepID=UPI004044C030